MAYRYVADLLLLLHMGFVLFVVLGALLALRWRWAPLAHLPAVAWGVYVEITASICPLTPLENHYRALAGQAGFEGGFVEHYLLALIYPAGLTANIQWLLGAGVAVINFLIYGWIVSIRIKR